METPCVAQYSVLGRLGIQASSAILARRPGAPSQWLFRPRPGPGLGGPLGTTPLPLSCSGRRWRIPGLCGGLRRGAVALTGEARSSLRALSLGAVDEAAFTCAGDDSGLCCGTAVPAGESKRAVAVKVAGSMA